MSSNRPFALLAMVVVFMVSREAFPQTGREREGLWDEIVRQLDSARFVGRNSGGKAEKAVAILACTCRGISIHGGWNCRVHRLQNHANAASIQARWFPGKAGAAFPQGLADTERRLGVKIHKPWLMGVSAGGRGGFRLYNQMSNFFKGYICLAGFPDTDTARSLRGNLEILMVNGTLDTMVPIGVAREQMKLAKHRVPNLEYREIQGDHFFMLSLRSEVFGVVKDFMGGKRPSPP